ncbi:hypothetical protein LOK49_LG06G00545 [Camellia lanceoleosa]|uniref:Uncharacterized protein n=1 Tax=Camellia lanceoleosa TaxID=1840588 RepID=A0ACC0HE07_9ERIC|nr:hypothetical protein LOK49_LG06G00545 [Camellia lanceoleosa]
MIQKTLPRPIQQDEAQVIFVLSGIPGIFVLSGIPGTHRGRERGFGIPDNTNSILLAAISPRLRLQSLRHASSFAMAVSSFRHAPSFAMAVSSLRHPSSFTMVKAVHSGATTPKDATSEAIWDWVTNVESTYYILGSVAGPRPYPMMVREFHAVIDKETRKQALEKLGGKPNILFACVGGASNAIGLFHEFVDDEDVRLIGVEATGFGLDSDKHTATLTKGEVGVLHGAMNYLLQDEDGQIVEPHSIIWTTLDLDHLGFGPEHSILKDIGHAEYYSITDKEALEAFKRLSRLEDMIPALETFHALAYLEKLCPTLSNGTKVVLNCSGRGDKDVQTAIKYLQVE